MHKMIIINCISEPLAQPKKIWLLKITPFIQFKLFTVGSIPNKVWPILKEQLRLSLVKAWSHIVTVDQQVILTVIKIMTNIW